MKDSEILRKAAERMKDGFSPEYVDGDCGCFVMRLVHSIVGRSIAPSILRTLGEIIGDEEFSQSGLIANGWTGRECTDDAVAALNIAADIAEAEGQ